MRECVCVCERVCVVCESVCMCVCVLVIKVFVKYTCDFFVVVVAHIL